MEQRFDKLEQKLERIADDIAEIKVVQAEQAKDLKYHIKRTTIQENKLEIFEEKLLKIAEAKNKLDGAFKVIGIIASVAAFVVSVLKLFFG